MSVRDRFSVEVCDGQVNALANGRYLALTLTQAITGHSTGVLLDDSEVELVINNLNLWLAAQRAGLLSDDDGPV